MKEDIAQRWIEALRSGEFKQGTNYLTQETEEGQQLDCCLGVLCKLAIADGVPLRMLPRELDEVHITYAWGKGENEVREVTVLPAIVQEWADLRSDDGSLTLEGEGTSLAGENDGAGGSTGRSFAQIAVIIDKYWEEL